MWSRKQSVCSAVSGVSKGDEPLSTGVQMYPFAVALRVRVLQWCILGLILGPSLMAVRRSSWSLERAMRGVSLRDRLRIKNVRSKARVTDIPEQNIKIVCGIGGLVVGAVGWLEEKQKPALGLGVPAGAITVIAATTSVYFSRGFGGWNSARSGTTRSWGTPWRALGPAPCAAVPLTILWTVAVGAHIAMLAFCIRSLMNIGCNSTTCIGVAVAQLAVSVSTLAAAVYMLQLDLRFDAALTPPRSSDTHICTGVSMPVHYTNTHQDKAHGIWMLGGVLMLCDLLGVFFRTRLYQVPLTSVAVNSGNSGDGGDTAGSPLAKEKNAQSPQLDPPT